MRLVDARRLTGPSHLAQTPLVVVEIGLDPGESASSARAAYASELGRMREALGQPPLPPLVTRLHEGGAVFGYEAPLDELHACAEASEWAALSACDVLHASAPHALEPSRAEIAGSLAARRSPALLALVRAARAHDVPLFWDDEVVSLGMGCRSVSFAADALPEPESVAWAQLGRIPVALVTGTNGKTTSSRLLARIASEAGLAVGITSTDGITVGSETVEDGDWTGPGAARIVLRRPEVELAVLETARGGILRRGLGVETCDAALITNVSDDHLGLYGIDDVAAMARVKGVVAHAVREGGTAALNARDPHLVALAAELRCNVVFFADLEGAPGPELEAARAVIAAHARAGGGFVVAEGGDIVSGRGETRRAVASVDALPITFGGAARYNVENVAGAVAVAEALGLPQDAVVRGVTGFGMRDNPGRGQILVRAGVTVVLDFGHNPEGVRAVMTLVSSLRKEGSRLTVITGSPGDRTDEEIASVARMVHAAKPDRIFVRELTEYIRGRAEGEVPALFGRTLQTLGFPQARFMVVASEVEALQRAFAEAAPGDLIAVLVHLDKDPVQALLATFA